MRRKGNVKETDKKITSKEKRPGGNHGVFDIELFLASAIETIVSTTPLIGSPAVALLHAVIESKKASESNDLQLLTEEAKRQRIELLMAEMQARVAQEMAIAQRIETASEVEIEEHYEGSAQGSAGLTMKEGAVTLGASGNGSKVTKRIYRFKGRSE